MLIKSEAISAMGKENHTRFMLPESERRYAAGSKTTSWRTIDVHMLKKPLPTACNTLPVIMQKPAKMKLRLIARKAGTPKVVLVLKKPKRMWGIKVNARRPISIMLIA